MYKKILFSLALLAFVVPQGAFAAEVKTNQEVSIPPGVYIQDDLYLVGGNVVVAGNSLQDLIAAGGNVLVNGSVGKDAHVAGGSLTILGAMGDDLRVVGGNITISSTVASDLVVAGGQVQILGNGIGGDALIAGGSIRIDASVRGSLRARGGTVYLNSPISGNVDIKAEKITLGPSANIQGNLTYSSPKEIVLEAGAQVKGKTTYTPITKPDVNAQGALFAIFSALFLLKFITILIGALLLALIFKRYARELVLHARNETWASFGRGIIWTIVLPILAVILCATIVGIPFGILTLIAFVSAAIFGMLLAPILLGELFFRKVLKKEDHPIDWKVVVVGVILFFLFGLIPFIGWIINCLLILIAIGAAIKIDIGVLQEWR